MHAPTDWFVVGDNPTVRTWHRYELEADGSTTLRVRQEWKNPEQFLSDTHAFSTELDGKRWGEGQIIGRIPDALLYTSGYMEARRNKDEAWIRRFWNDGDHSRLRVKQGRI